MGDIQHGHPKLILTEERLDDLMDMEIDDPDLQRYLSMVLERADKIAGEPMLKYEIPDGKRLLKISRKCLDRVLTLGVAYRWTGDEKYRKALLDNLLTVCAFKDWNPSHFLDTAEMTEAVALGYDWLYHDMSEEDRETIRQAIITHGLEPGLASYSGQEKYGWWTNANHNWNLVCNAGMITGALAVADTDPQYAQVIIPAALESIPRALNQYGPDGAWAEGPGYWDYATKYVQFGISALVSATGTDYGLLDTPGLSETGRFPVASSGPTGRPLSYADCNGNGRLFPASAMFWHAGAYDDEFVANFEHSLLDNSTWMKPGLVIWYVPRPDKDIDNAPLDQKYRGPVELAFMRSAWNDPDALFVGVKAGDNKVNHAHLDLGNFELDALGVRWARDLGGDNYNMPGYFHGGADGPRWQYYRLNSQSHNVPLIDGKNQRPRGTASMVRFEAGDESSTEGDIPFVEIDLTDGYKGQVTSLKRGIALVGGRRAALVQDEFVLPKASTVSWGMTTEADIVYDKSTALLTQDGKQLQVRVLSPAGATFSVESAEQAPPQNPNKGIQRLMVHLPDQSDEVRLVVLLSPVWPDGNVIESWDIQPLADW
ncbi:heparinase II/III family protein [Ruficoccus sp. ZRK36]|uniref:heparinase II/III domain-containing protein n=1 Tax=Ruficoccus sp. ZRK36 TaxID=2866311 RepID=UPI001C72F781|nr:heparinase II/III family protein [Ruficoccus sp. ZRK36]QYY35209.1 heparinase II/III family protein [Ruficoccus sp. ZRK36]